MLTITDISYRLGGRTLFEKASAQIGDRQKVGLVGRNGTGKSTLLRMLRGELTPDEGEITVAARRRVGSVAQEVPSGDRSLLDIVLEADVERTALLEEEKTAIEPHRIADIHTRLADIGAHSAPARAAIILSGLGFDEEAQQQPIDNFSGGWKMRVALAAALFSEPDFLLLDEPTNHLDLEAALWLEDYLSTYPRGLVLVSHDRGLLNRIPEMILHLDNGRLTRYSGGYDRFERTRAEHQARQAALYSKQQDQRRHIQAFVDRFRAKATKARQAQSRLKMLQRMEPIAAVVEDRSITFNLPKPDPLSPPLIVLENATIGYDLEKPILHDLDLRIDMDDRIALLGANGNGKTTLLRLLARRLKVLDGTYRASSKLEVGYFAQNQLDELTPGKTPLQYLQNLEPMATEQSLRAHLGAFAFDQDKADVQIANLSGGEKARLALSVICRKKPHVLLLDEPTNHLDIDARQALVHALAEYEGAVILVSHDPHLVNACADRLWLVAEGSCAPFDGDLDDYRQLLFEQRRREKRQKRQEAGLGPVDGVSTKKDDRRARADARAVLAPLRKQLAVLEKTLEKRSRERDVLHDKLAAPETYDLPAGDLAKLQKQLSTIEEEISDAELAWLEISEELETASG